jgi:SHS2 domain-containing protein
MSGYRFLPHTADMKIEARGCSLEEAFAQASAGLKDAICGPVPVQERFSKHVEVEGADCEQLLYVFLEEFLFLLDSENFLLSRVTGLAIGNNRLSADVLGDDAGNYEFSNNVKAVTYSEMTLTEKNDEWVACFVLDV